LELRLTSAFLTASECLIIAGNDKTSELRLIDLSCNPITATGLFNLCHPHRSSFEKLTELILFNCEIDSSQAYLISNDNLESGKCRFALRKLNLSHNNIDFFINYVIELGLMSPVLQ
jgi:hypothetical protein